MVLCSYGIAYSYVERAPGHGGKNVYRRFVAATVFPFSAVLYTYKYIMLKCFSLTSTVDHICLLAKPALHNQAQTQKYIRTRKIQIHFCASCR